MSQNWDLVKHFHSKKKGFGDGSLIAYEYEEPITLCWIIPEVIAAQI
jgi:hypothetical protein